ncbi:BON domain-containing protein [Variovorax sp. OK605]|uniref:BON domain-containing protein n=1 Tax=Variovorax sp. OK605 TaxID=1855317 RepID=UPI00210E8573|nr:BON domain-containing protein [Variovorax sp. OK605]
MVIFRPAFSMPRTACALFLAFALILAGCAGSTLRESTGEYVDDAVITARIKADLLAYREVSTMQVHVETFKGRVQLSGFVKSGLQRFVAESIARSTKGVNGVINDIELR